MDQPATAALHRIGGAHHGQPRRLACAAAGVPGGGPQRPGDGPGRAGRLMASRALATVSPKASTDSATTPSGAMLATSAEPMFAARA
jgi:hypothetical protein